ncbi:uncharacterized protein LOC116125932 isoform X2 [Pistacia vera]|uniref:uncharacterized protein LOC116125932 isoform X2 n=1 Tax=Pistacia vera TaxID=55513 RepID=UPI00126353B6|nr:uncharacterized protein LOC116125932 isoform X2 [Pistacia vera]
MHEPAQVKFANASDYAVPSLTFSYNAGGSQQSTSSSVINSNPSASPVAFQPPITRSASSSEKMIFNDLQLQKTKEAL